MLKMALFINSIIVICECYTLGHIRSKWNILKYYTYLQNFLALLASLFFVICLIACESSGREILEFAKGLRYMATCGLICAMFIFIVFLRAGKRIAITEEDFLSGFSPKTANNILHYICPILSLISFVFFEREIHLLNGIWTGIVAIPSCMYWTVYIILTSTKLWVEPYDFSSQNQKGSVCEILSLVLIPLSFVATSFVLWNIK